MVLFERLSLSALLLSATAMFGAGCATTSHQAAGEVTERPSAPARQDPAAVTIAPLAFGPDGFAYVDGATGAALSKEDVFARVRAANAILVGEQHNLASHHRLQAEIVQVASDGGPLAVAFEMIANNHADALDRFSRGEIDIDGLFTATNWEKEWGHDFEIYRPIFVAAQAANAKLYGVNAPRTLVRALAKKGIEGLTDDERAQLPQLDLDDEEHRRGIQEFFEQHHPAIDRHKAFDSFYRVQVLWDESMAEGSAKALNEVGRVVVIAGNGHIAGYRNIPNRLLRRVPTAKMLTIVPVTLDDTDDAMEVAKDAVVEREADILAIERPRETFAL